jgi:hypothetical protein
LAGRPLRRPAAPACARWPPLTHTPPHPRAAALPPQGNLKCFAAGKNTQPVQLFDELLPADVATELEHWYQQQQFETLSELAACPAQQKSELEQLRALLLETKGLPGPFSGIKAID